MRRDKHETAPNYPEGFRYRPEIIGPDEEAALVARVRELPFRDFEFHGYTGKRRVDPSAGTTTSRGAIS